MRILLHTDSILRKMGGATISTIKTMEILVGFGHQAAIIAKKIESNEVFGIPVYNVNETRKIRTFYSWADVVFVMRKTPLIHLKEYEVWHVPHGAYPIYSAYFAHNIGQPYRYGYREGDVDLVVFNTDWVKNESDWSGESFVLHPPIFKEDYLVTPGDHITQINLAKKKGGELFWEIAKALPKHKFLAVLGNRTDQIIPSTLPKNVEITNYKSDIRKIYSKTKILLMPSQGYGIQNSWSSDNLWTESYGRVGVEAAISGIPVIAFPTPGIKEALGNKGIYCDHHLTSWVEQLNRLSKKDEYDTASKSIREIGEVLSPLEDIARLEKLLLTRLSDAVINKPKRYKAFFSIEEHKQRIETLPEKEKIGTMRRTIVFVKNIVKKICKL